MMYRSIVLLRRSLRIVLLWFPALFVAGCGCGVTRTGRHSCLNKVMDSAEYVMNDNPAKAGSLLAGVDPSGIRRRKDQARYALLMTESRYKNYLPIADDSLIMTAVRYYSKGNEPQLLFRSYYMLGCVYEGLSLHSDAIVALSQAGNYLPMIDDSFRKGMFYMKMGTILFDTFNFPKAEEYLTKAYDSFQESGHDYYRICALGEIGGCKMQTADYPAAVEYYGSVADWARENGDAGMESLFLMNRISGFVLGNDREGAKDALEGYLSRFRIQDDDSRSLYIMARYYILAGDTLNAGLFLDKAWNVCAETDSARLYYAESLLNRQKGRYKSALDYSVKTISLQNDAIRRELYYPVSGAQSDYYRALSELESLKARNKTIIFLTAIVLLSFVTLSLYVLAVYRKRRADQKIRDYLYAIDELTSKETLNRQTIDNLNAILKEKKNSLNSKVKELLRQQFSTSDFLYTRYYENLDDGRKAERLYRVVKSQIENFTSSRNIERMDSLLDDAYSGIMQRLTSGGLDLKERELMLLRFVLAGFSAKSTAALLNDSHLNIGQRKKRLLDKIGKLSPALLDELETVLNSEI